MRIEAGRTCHVCGESVRFVTDLTGNEFETNRVKGKSFVFGSEPGSFERRLMVGTYATCNHCGSENLFTYKHEKEANETFFFDLEMKDNL